MAERGRAPSLTVVATRLSSAQPKDTYASISGNGYPNLVVALFESSKVDPTPQPAPAYEPSP